jgi:MoxR-like ATPase
MGYPEHEDAVSILKGEVWNQLESLEAIMDLQQLRRFRQMGDEVYVHDEIYEYIVSLVECTRSHEFFSMGASPRAAIALLKMSRGMAVLAGRDYVTAQDVQSVLKDVLGHRVKLSARARAEGKSMEECMEELKHSVKSPRC